MTNQIEHKKFPPFSHEKGFCWVSEKYKLIFLPIPKNASTSIRSIEEFQFQLDNAFRYQTRIESGEYKIFTIVREPIDRFVSGYIEICKRAYGDSPQILKRDFYWMKDEKIRFYKFVEEVEGSFFNSHIRPQSYFLTDYENNFFNIDFVLNFYSLQKSFNELLDRYNLRKVELPQKNIRSGIEKNISSRMSKKLSNLFSMFVSQWYGDKRRAIYLLFDKAAHSLPRHPLPDKNAVHAILQNDHDLVARLNVLYKDDWLLYNNRNQKRNLFHVFDF